MLYVEKRIQVRHKALLLYELTEYPDRNSKLSMQRRCLQIKEDKKQAYSGKLTQGAKKRLTKAIDLMCQSIKVQRIYSPIAMREVTHRLSFITLTISQKENITAREGYDKAFKHFIQWLRRSKKVATYVWKLEVQKRGQIHYHITTPSYIPYQEIRDKWNNLQRNNGWLKEYYNKTGHYDPNSTDIKEVRKISNLSGYLIKEFCKSIQNPDSNGKVWDCSLNLKKWKYYNIQETNNNNSLMADLIEERKVDVIKTDYCTILKMVNANTVDVMNLEQIKGYDDFLTMIRNYRT